MNRLLLEEAYPEEIAKGCDSIIYKGPARKTTNPNSKQPKHHETPYFINANLLVLKFLVLTMDLAFRRSDPEMSKETKDKLEKLKEQFEWQMISDHEYQKMKRKLEFECYDDEFLHIAQSTHKLLDEFLSTKYLLQFVKKYGFKWTVHRIHEMVKSWDRCWALGESAIKCGIINDESNLKCAKKLVQYHLDVEEGFKRLDEEDDGKI